MKVPAQSTIVLLAVISVIIVLVATIVSEQSVNQYISQQTAIDEAVSFQLVDSAMEVALMELQRASDYAGQTLAFPEGDVTVTVADLGGGQRQVTAVGVVSGIRREISATVTVTSQENPLETVAVFGGDDVDLIKNNSQLVGNLWTNDNVNLDENTTVKGNVFAAGLGNVSNSSVRNGAQVIDNPSTLEVEGNISAIDRIRVVNSGIVQGTATSKTEVQVASGGSVGSSVVDPNLVIDTIQVPSFDFDTYKSQAQTAGTYYATAAQFLNYLDLNGNTITGGVHYIEAGNLTLSDTATYNVTGSIISNADINIRGISYTHMYENNLPVLASKGTVTIEDSTPCGCTADITGIVFANESITSKHDQYNGAEPFAVDIVGALWAGDIASVQDSTSLTFDMTLVQNVEGFSFQAGGGGGGPTSNNIIEVINWDIN